MWINETIVAWLFLGVSLVGAVFTLNAFVPVRRVPVLFVPSFFGSWLTAELALHHIVWQALITVLFVQFGALSSWPGLVGMARDPTPVCPFLYCLRLAASMQIVPCSDVSGMDFKEQSRGEGGCHR